jgi:hypothetical protein
VTDITLMDVQARWGYSEIVDSNHSDLYDKQPFAPLYKDQLAAVRAKHRSGLLFEELISEDRYWLAFMCSSLRTNLMVFVTGVECFRETHLNKTIIAALVVPSMVSNLPFMSFRDYIRTPCSDPKDARNVVPSVGSYRPPADPLTVGRLDNTTILLDGYHRAASFWKFAPENASISAYVPAVLLCTREA